MPQKSLPSQEETTITVLSTKKDVSNHIEICVSAKLQQLAAIDSWTASGSHFPIFLLCT